MFHFAQPLWLFALLALPLLAFWHWRRVQRDRRALEAFAWSELLARMNVNPGNRARLVRGYLLILALALGLLALAQPRVGLGAAEALQMREGNVVVVLDLSKSMLTRDALGESRLAAAQRLLAETLPKLAGWKVGVVVFAGEAQALVPLTSDHAAVTTLLARAKVGEAPGRGSNVEAGLSEAVQLFRRPGRQAVLLLSDGESHAGNPRTALPRLRRGDIQLIVVGLGTPEGDVVPGATDLWGNPAPLTFRGEKVLSRLDEATLKRLAADAGGTYIPGSSPGAPFKLASLLRPPAGTTAASAAETEPAVAGYELFQLPLALALLLLLGEAAWGLLGRARPEVRFADSLARQLGGARVGEAARRGAVSALLVAVALSQTAWTWSPSWLINGEAGRAFTAGEFGRAEAKLHEGLKESPDDPRLLYNLGGAYYAQGRFREAAAALGRAWERADASLRPVISYNLGNAQFRMAESTNSVSGFEQAIASYEQTLEALPDDADAKHNLEVARRRLKEAKAAPQRPNSQGGGQPSAGNGAAQGPIGSAVRQRVSPVPKNLPSESEVDALLRALENDERQRQAEAAGEQDPAAQGLLESAMNSLDLQKDW